MGGKVHYLPICDAGCGLNVGTGEFNFAGLKKPLNLSTYLKEHS
jgi:hypothetical protein